MTDFFNLGFNLGDRVAVVVGASSGLGADAARAYAAAGADVALLARRVDRLEALGEEITVETPREQLVAHAERIGLEIDDYAVAGKVVEDIFEELVGNKLWAPTFVYDFPEDTSPLTRYHRSKPGLTEKWDLYVRGFETATAYSELADPVVQRERFEAQALAAA